MSFALEAPDPWFAVPEGEREARGVLGSDQCIIDGREFYIRGCLELPVRGQDAPFVWGVWVSVSERSFKTIDDLWEATQRDHMPPMFGWLCNGIRLYPETRALKTNVHLRNNGIRPFIELEPTDHPLAVEQREGITLERVAEIAAAARMH
jgi:hypothetical protein